MKAFETKLDKVHNILFELIGIKIKIKYTSFVFWKF